MEQNDKDIEQAIRLANSSRKKGYQQILENNVSSYGAETIKVRREKKKVDKKIFSRNGVKALLTVAMLLASLNIFITAETFKFEKTVDYVNSQLVTESVMNINGENIQEKTESFIKEMTSKGLSENSVLFFIKDMYGNDAFDIAVQTLGYKDGDEYIISEGYMHQVLSSSGETVYAIYPREFKYENESRKDLIEEVKEIKESRKGK